MHQKSFLKYGFRKLAGLVKDPTEILYFNQDTAIIFTFSRPYSEILVPDFYLYVSSTSQRGNEYRLRIGIFFGISCLLHYNKNVHS